MKQPSDFWDKHAAHYDRFLRRDMAAYQQMYELICPAVRHKTVLELATGTGLIASHIINAAEQIEATDASEEMISGQGSKPLLQAPLLRAGYVSSPIRGPLL